MHLFACLEIESCRVAQGGLELVVPLPQLPSAVLKVHATMPSLVSLS